MKLSTNGFIASMLLLLGSLCAFGQSQLISQQAEHTLSAEDISFGEQQVEAMVSDRPKMARFAKKDDPLWTWAAEQYAGAFTGHRYEWRKALEEAAFKGFAATHRIPSAKENGCITVREIDGDGYSLGGEQMWELAVFELFNIRNDSKFENFQNQASAHQLTKQQFERSVLECEYHAEQNVSVFYKNFVAPYRQKAGLEVHDNFWHPKLPATFEEWFFDVTHKMNYARFPVYARAYDKLVAPQQGKHN